MGKRSNPTFIELDFVEEVEGRPRKRRQVSSQFAAIALLSIRASLGTSQRKDSAAVKPVKDILHEVSSVTDDECDDHSHLVQSPSFIKDINSNPSSVTLSSQPPPIGLALHRPLLARTAPKPVPQAQKNMMISKLPLGRPLPPAPSLAPRHFLASLKPINLSLQASRK